MQGSDSESTFESTLERKKELGGVFSPLWAQAARRATNHSFGVKNTHSVEFRIRRRKGDSKVDTLAVATEQINTLYPDCSTWTYRPLEYLVLRALQLLTYS